MSKVLIITPSCPYPPHKSGGTHALYNIIKENKNEKRDIDLLYFDEKDELAEKEILKYVDNIIYIDLRKKFKFINRIVSIIKGIPYGIYQYESKKLQLQQSYDKIIFDQLLTLNFIDSIQARNNVLMAYDSMSLYFLRKAQIESGNMISKLYNRLQNNFYEKLQKVYYKKFDEILFVSENDAIHEREKNQVEKNKIDFINLGVNFELFNSSRYKKCSEKSIIFTGIMDYSPNKDAVMYFAKFIFPRILEKHKDVKFYIVGKNPDEDIKALENKNIVVTGFVDDIVEYIANSTIYISPLRYGTGMKNKVLEAMSTGKSIVASSVSIEGINELKHKENIFEANTEDEWIEYIDILLNESKIREDFGQRCRSIIVENYSWAKAFKRVIG